MDHFQNGCLDTRHISYIRVGYKSRYWIVRIDLQSFIHTRLYLTNIYPSNFLGKKRKKKRWWGKKKETGVGDGALTKITG